MCVVFIFYDEFLNIVVVNILKFNYLWSFMISIQQKEIFVSIMNVWFEEIFKEEII